MELGSGKVSEVFCSCESPLDKKLVFNQTSCNSFSVMPDVLISGNLEYKFSLNYDSNKSQPFYL